MRDRPQMPSFVGAAGPDRDGLLPDRGPSSLGQSDERPAVAIRVMVYHVDRSSSLGVAPACGTFHGAQPCQAARIKGRIGPKQSARCTPAPASGAWRPGRDLWPCWTLGEWSDRHEEGALRPQTWAPSPGNGRRLPHGIGCRARDSRSSANSAGSARGSTSGGRRDHPPGARHRGGSAAAAHATGQGRRGRPGCRQRRLPCSR